MNKERKIRTEPFILSAADAVDRTVEFLKQDADLDELAAIISVIFGCEIEISPDEENVRVQHFRIIPTKDYSGGLDL